MAKIALGFGSNLGNREENLKNAIDLVVQKKILHQHNISSMLNNKALLLPDSPESWDLDFLNCVVIGNTELLPHELWTLIKQIEQDLGRKSKKTWSPREIDIDLLVYDDLCLRDLDINIPHQGLIERDFAIGLLAQLWPDWQYPVPGRHYKRTAHYLSQRLSS